MILKDIIAISGEPGLFKFIAQGKNAIIVEHLETRKRSTAYGSAKVSSLEDIAIFTDGEDIPLGKVFDIIFEKENGGATTESKADPEKLKKWFADILPAYSRDKVYVSDIKKVAQWYNLLNKLEMLVKEDPEPVAEAEPENAEETIKTGESAKTINVPKSTKKKKAN